MASRWSEWIRSGMWAQEGQAKIPMLPAHVHELARLAADPEVTVTQIAVVVAKDPVLAMQVIKMANSALSAPAMDIKDIREAVARLGTQTVRNLVVTSCMSAQMTDPKIYGPAGRQVVDHGLGTAIIASALAPRVDMMGELFLGGLLHDVGKLLILKLAHDFRAALPDEANQADVDETLKTRHPHMGGWLAARWSMPATLADPIAWHHDLEWAVDYQPTAIVYGANRLAHRYGFGCDPDTADPLVDPVFEEIEVDAARLATLDERMPALYKSTRSVMVR